SVYLEPISEKHIDGLFAIGQVADDWLYMPRPCFQSLQDTSEWVQEALMLADKGIHTTFVICDSDTLQPVGSSRYLNVRKRDRGLEIGYTWMAKHAQRTAANTEAKLLLLTHAFEALGMIRVELKTDARNTRSQTAIARLGAKREGTFRRHMIVQDGYIRDSVYFSIVDSEWPTIKAGLQSKLDLLHSS
ncbi:MAG: GNAT family N-acetyltransferase, partial [Pseudomonadales bacterium]|nr:GNAT family N-acetyltransferase [Pseudomonadales bacterium]